jgi:ribonuclease HI
VGESLHNHAAMKVIAHVDGGARGNPGPAAAAAVLRSPEGDLLDEATQLLGSVTNNVAEYRALLLGLQRARELGADEVDLHLDAIQALRGFASWSIRTVPRAQNADADALVNAALDQAAASSRGL